MDHSVSLANRVPGDPRHLFDRVEVVAGSPARRLSRDLPRGGCRGISRAKVVVVPTEA